jgi:hypothetical protein
VPKSSRRYGNATKVDASTAATVATIVRWASDASSRLIPARPNSTAEANAAPSENTGPAVAIHVAFAATGMPTPVVSAPSAVRLCHTAG